MVSDGGRERESERRESERRQSDGYGKSDQPAVGVGAGPLLAIAALALAVTGLVLARRRR